MIRVKRKPYKMMEPADLEPARIELEIALNTMRTNEPINRKEGNIEQADLERSNAVSYKAAISKLK